MLWALFGVIWVMPQSVTDLFTAWQGPFGRHCNIDLWRDATKGTLDALRERNGRFLRLNISSSTHLLDWSSVLILFHVLIF